MLNPVYIIRHARWTQKRIGQANAWRSFLPHSLLKYRMITDRKTNGRVTTSQPDSQCGNSRLFGRDNIQGTGPGCARLAESAERCMRHTRMILSPMPQREILGRIRMQADVDSEIHDLWLTLSKPLSIWALRQTSQQKAFWRGIKGSEWGVDRY